MIEKINGVESARSIYPNTCSCMVDYLGQNKTYKEHLLECHLVKI